MDPVVIAAVRTIGQALDSAKATTVGELRFVVMTLSSYAQRRDLAMDRAASNRAAAEEAQVAADTWYRRLPPALQWRGRKRLCVGKQRVEGQVDKISVDRGNSVSG
jgi:hypothetical protein